MLDALEGACEASRVYANPTNIYVHKVWKGWKRIIRFHVVFYVDGVRRNVFFEVPYRASHRYAYEHAKRQLLPYVAGHQRPFHP